MRVVLDGVHGTYGYQLGCRCKVCKRAKREAWRAWGKSVAGKEPPRHGSASSYRNWSCRCEPCTAANTAAHAEWAARARGARTTPAAPAGAPGENQEGTT